MVNSQEKHRLILWYRGRHDDRTAVAKAVAGLLTVTLVAALGIMTAPDTEAPRLASETAQRDSGGEPATSRGNDRLQPARHPEPAQDVADVDFHRARRDGEPAADDLVR